MEDLPDIISFKIVASDVDPLSGGGGGGGAGPFSVTCDWPFLKSVICDRGIFCDV